MNIAILSVGILSLGCSAASLYYMRKTWKKVASFGEDIKTEVETVKAKVTRNAAVVKAALAQIEV